MSLSTTEQEELTDPYQQFLGELHEIFGLIGQLIHLGGSAHGGHRGRVGEDGQLGQ